MPILLKAQRGCAVIGQVEGLPAPRPGRFFEGVFSPQLMTAHASKPPADTAQAAPGLRGATAQFVAEAAKIEQGGGPSGIERQHRHGRLTARERIAQLLDPGTWLMELGLFAAWNMYREYGGAPAAGVVTGIGVVDGRQ